MPQLSAIGSGRISNKVAPPSTAAAPKPPGHKRRRLVLWIGLSLLLLVVLGGVGALIFLQPSTLISEPVATAPTATSSAQVTPEVSSGPQTASGRDEVRLQHLVKIHTALEQYRQANGRYPDKFEQLVAYLPTLPTDPSGAAYPYAVITDGTSYQLQFTLETGGLYNDQRLLIGSYFLTAQGVTIQTSLGTPTSTVSIIPEPGDTPPPATADTDGDSLTDVEEAQYATDVNVSDTDGDGYVDGVEVRAGFNPLVREVQTLLEAGLIQSYQNITQGYAVNYPTGWITRALDAPQATQITFTSPNGEFFEVLAEPNPSNMTVAEWYQQQHPQADVSSLAAVTYGNLTGVRAPDGLTVYLTNGTTMYVLVYSLGGASQASYITSFQYFQSSFQVIGR